MNHSFQNKPSLGRMEATDAASLLASDWTGTPGCQIHRLYVDISKDCYILTNLKEKIEPNCFYTVIPVCVCVGVYFFFEHFVESLTVKWCQTSTDARSPHLYSCVSLHCFPVYCVVLAVCLNVSSHVVYNPRRRLISAFPSRADSTAAMFICFDCV